jgi:hypothetical protein
VKWWHSEEFGSKKKADNMVESNDLRDSNDGTFKTINCEYIWIDEPGDHTVRPIRPSLLEHARRERAKVYGSPEPGPQPPGQ